MKRFGNVLIATLALGGAQLAAADEAVGTTLSTTVQYAELDLNSPKAVEILHRRLSRAAEQVCAPLEGRELWRLREHRQCVVSALSQAVERVNRPMLTRYHVERSASSLPHVAAR